MAELLGSILDMAFDVKFEHDLVSNDRFPGVWNRFHLPVAMAPVQGKFALPLDRRESRSYSLVSCADRE